MLHIYAFGSICRGEILEDSDCDLLAISTGEHNRLSKEMFSIYSHKRIHEIWAEGNPFAWHIHLESKPIFLEDRIDFIDSLGKPSKYRSKLADCEKFFRLFLQSKESLMENRLSVIFDISTIFLAMRNFSSCYLLNSEDEFDFSRNSALRLMGDTQPIDVNVYYIFERARILCTRGIGGSLLDAEVDSAISSLPDIEVWLRSHLSRLTR